MMPFLLRAVAAVVLAALLASAGGRSAGAQSGAQAPEETFPEFVVEAPYVPLYRGRDPFRPLGEVESAGMPIRIGELRYLGTLVFEGVDMALFSLQRDPGMRFVLKYRKLYDGNDEPVGGVAGEIREDEVILTQGGRTLRIPRNAKESR